MKYPQLVSTPAVVKEWLEAELECLGIDSAAYARTVLSLLSRDTVGPAEVIQSGYVLVANKVGGRGPGGLGGPHPPRTREEELKRAEVIECLRSASEDQGGIQLLVDQLISMLKQLPAASEPTADTASDSGHQPATGDPAPPDDPVLRYEAAFPALSRGSPGVIPLTFFSKMSRPAGAAAAAGLWRPGLPLPPPPAYTAAPLEPAAPPPPPKPPETARVIRPSAETHFQPIRRASGDDSATEWPPPATYEARLYMRSDSGGLYLEDEGPRPAAQPPQKYMIYREESPPVGARRGLAPKFKLSCNEKYCQTDEPAAEGDLLQILVSGEQAGEVDGAPAADADYDDDSSCEVLSSLQQTLNSIYEDDSGTEPEPEPEPERRAAAALAPARRPSAFARVRRPSAGHRPLYLRGGGADSLLAAVYAGGGWSPGPEQVAEHRPLYARQPEFAEHRQLTSGRISGAVYQQGPTEYPALRYQLAGRDRPEVTFCRLGGDTHSSGPLKEDPAAEPAAAWEADSDAAARSSREPSVGSEPGGTLWQAAGRRRSSVDSSVWDPSSTEAAADAGALWETPRDLAGAEDALAPGPLWEVSCSLVLAEDAGDLGALWGTPRELTEREVSAEPELWKTQRSLEEPQPVTEAVTLWETPRELAQVEDATGPELLCKTQRSLEEPQPVTEAVTLWETPRELAQAEDATEPEVLWGASLNLAEPNAATNPATLWDTQCNLMESETAERAALWEAPRSLAEPEAPSDPDALWEASRSLAEPEAPSDPGALWEAPHSLAEPEVPSDKGALWEAPRSLAEPEAPSDPEALWEAPRSLAEPEAPSDPGSLWEAPRSLAAPEDPPEPSGWERRRSRAERESSVEMTIWDTSGEQLESAETTANIWKSRPAPVSRDASIDTLWSSAELPRRDRSIEESRWEFSRDRSVDRSADEPAMEALWEVRVEPPLRQASAERSLWESPAELTQSGDHGERTAWEPAEGSLWEPGEPPLPEIEESPGWPSWQEAPLRAPELIWRRGEPADAGGGGGGEGEQRELEVRRLLWRLGGEDVLAQTGLYPADPDPDPRTSWEFIDENNVKNKIDANAGPLASELTDGEAGGWGGVLPALRQLSQCLGLAGGAPLPDGVAIHAWALEEQWRKAAEGPRPTRDRRGRKSDRKRPCSYFMEGNCKRNDCKFSHDLSAITCVFWEESGCFKGVHCPFLHGYPADDEEDEDSSDSAKRAVPKKSFKLEKEDFPSLHNMKKWHRNDEEDSRRAAGRRSCRRHKSFSEAALGGAGDPEPPRPAIGGRGKRRRHHSKSEGVRPADAGARRP